MDGWVDGWVGRQATPASFDCRTGSTFSFPSLQIRLSYYHTIPYHTFLRHGEDLSSSSVYVYVYIYVYEREREKHTVGRTDMERLNGIPAGMPTVAYMYMYICMQGCKFNRLNRQSRDSLRAC